MYTNDEIRKELSRFYENLQTYAEWLDAAESELKNYFFKHMVVATWMNIILCVMMLDLKTYFSKQRVCKKQ